MIHPVRLSHRGAGFDGILNPILRELSEDMRDLRVI